MDLYKNLINKLDSDLWFNSRLDRNGIFLSNKLSHPRGNIGTINYPRNQYTLPDNTSTFILVSLGPLPLNRLGLDNLTENWVSTQTLFQNNTWLFCFSLGRSYSLINSFIKVTTDNEVLIAIDYLVNLNLAILNKDIYIRFYSNVFYNLNPSSQMVHHFAIYNSTTPTDYLNFVATTSIDYRTLIFKNGLLLPNGIPARSTLVTGDVLESIFDPSIIGTLTLPLTSLEIYNSTLDKANKLLVNLPLMNDDRVSFDRSLVSNVGDIIQWVSNNPNIDLGSTSLNDMEFYITGLNRFGNLIGVYLPLLDITTIRPLTEKDYGIKANSIQNLINDLNIFSDVGTLTNVNLVIVRRVNGYNRTPVNDSNYTCDLMNLIPSLRKTIMTGINSNLPIWLANNLESCPMNTYLQSTHLKGTPINYFGVITRKEALTMLESMPKLPNGNYGLPVSCLDTGSVVHFDNNGKFPNVYAVDRVSFGNGMANGELDLFVPFNTSATELELVIPANNVNDTTVSGNFDILCLYVNQGLRIATLGVDYTLVDNHLTNVTTIKWSVNLMPYQRYVRSAANGIYSISNLTLDDATSGIDAYNGYLPLIEIGMGSLLVWVNGDYLIYGLDYKLFNGKIYLSSKRKSWTNNFTLQYLYLGLPDHTLIYNDTTKFGFIRNNTILEDGKYDLLVYRNKMFIVDGRIISVNFLNEKEHYSDLPYTAINPSLFPNGAPYAIVDKPTFIRKDILDAICHNDQYEKDLDNQVSDFLSLLNPLPIPTDTVFITEHYEIVSVLMNRLIHDLTNGILVLPNTISFTENQVMTIVSQYLWMLHVDLTQATNIDFNYVVFSPSWDTTPRSVNQGQYVFLTMVNSLVLGNKVQRLGSYLTIV